MNWESMSPLEPDRVRFVDSQGTVHTVPASEIEKVFEIDPDARVLATGPEEWLAFVNDQKSINTLWRVRNIVTESDVKLLGAMGISLGRPQNWMEETVNLYSLRGDED